MTPSPHVVHWNPSLPRFSGRFGRRLPFTRPINNFGDLLGPVIVEAELRARGLDPGHGREVDLLTVGSILHFATDAAVVWGTGRNGKIVDGEHRFSDLDVRAVRGPSTRAFLQARGIEVPAVYGDPALLLPRHRPDLQALSHTKKRSVTVVPNLNDLPRWAGDPDVLDPRSPLEKCLARIVQSELVIGSSLHGVIVAEAFGVPARFISSGSEDPFKYVDYLTGTGRTEFRPAADRAEAIAMGGQPAHSWDPEPLLAAFPDDLWNGAPARDGGARA